MCAQARADQASTVGIVPEELPSLFIIVIITMMIICYYELLLLVFETRSITGIWDFLIG